MRIAVLGCDEAWEAVKVLVRLWVGDSNQIGVILREDDQVVSGYQPLFRLTTPWDLLPAGLWLQ